MALQASHRSKTGNLGKRLLEPHAHPKQHLNRIRAEKHSPSLLHLIPELHSVAISPERSCVMRISSTGKSSA